jgi:hypothetical protein
MSVITTNTTQTPQRHRNAVLAALLACVCAAAAYTVAHDVRDIQPIDGAQSLTLTRYDDLEANKAHSMAALGARPIPVARYAVLEANKARSMHALGRRPVAQPPYDDLTANKARSMPVLAQR